MYEANFNVLKDKAMDVDPDLRFMALQDFQKYLNKPDRMNYYNNSQYIVKFIPVLFRLLHDQNTDVQSQAVSSFEPLVGVVANDVLLGVIKQLFKLVREQKTEGFTTSIPNMALKTILNKQDPATFTAKFQRQICDALIASLKTSVTVDSLEIMNDVINNMGSVLTAPELVNLSEFLIATAFKGLGIVSKLSIVGFESLSRFMDDSVTLNHAVAFVVKGNNAGVKFQLFSIVFKSVLLVDSQLLDTIYREILATLSSQEQYLDDDIDFDKILEGNLMKEGALTVLIDLVNSNNDITRHQQELFQVISHFINYDPLNNGEDDIEDDSYSEIIEFSDDENEDDYSENDGSWKLRIKAAILFLSYLDKFPSSFADRSSILDKLPIDDSNELASNEAMKTAIKIIESEPGAYGGISNKIVNKLLVESKVNQFPKILKLIESLQNRELIEIVFERFFALKVITRASMDYLSFYRNILKYGPSDKVINYICLDIEESLNDKSFNVIKESIKVLTAVVRDGYKINNIGVLVDILISKINNSKIYSSDLLQLCIICCSEIIVHLRASTDEILEAFKSSLTLDCCIKTIIENLILLLRTGNIAPNLEYQQFLLGKLGNFLLSNDDYLSSASLQLLRLVLESGIIPNNSDIIITNILKVLSWEKPISVEFDILRLVTVHDISHHEEVLKTLVKLINNSEIEEYVAPSLYELFKSLSSTIPDLYEYLLKKLDLTLFVSAKILAIISTEHQLNNEIENRQLQLLAQLGDKLTTSNNELLFNIQYLANVSESVNLNLIQVAQLLGYLNDANSVQLSQASKSEENAVITNEEIVKSAISKFIGIMTKRNMNDLQLLIENYQCTENIKTRIYLVNALKIVLRECSPQGLEIIWSSIINSNSNIEFDQTFTAELRNSADVLSEICLINKDHIQLILNQYTGEETEKLGEIYTIIIVVKDLINQLDDNDENNAILNKLILLIMKYSKIVNIEIRQAIMGTLLTSLHNRSAIIVPNLNETILPILYSQLTAEPAFKKIIQMGPYKYVVDEGMEIRKLIYEFLYTIGLFENKTIEEYQINIGDMAKSIIQQGLADEQIDLVVLSCINLINFITNQQEKFFELIIKDNGTILNALINNLTLQLNKKLSAKASTQDTENYQERLKGIIKLSKTIEKTFNLSSKDKNLQIDELVNNWNAYFSSLKEKFFHQFTQVEI